MGNAESEGREMEQKHMMAAVVVVTIAASVLAAPQLKTQPEVLVDGELKAKVLANSKGVPMPTPAAQTGYTISGGVRKDFKVYNPADLWRARAEIGTWEDRNGNVMKLARVVSLVPDIPELECTKEAVGKALEELEKSFKADEESLAAWKTLWAPTGEGKFVSAGGKTYWVEFRFAENVRKADADRLLATFERSVSARTWGMSGAGRTMKWWEAADANYKFLTNLDKAKGTTFIKQSQSMMEALRKKFEFYVPAKKTPPLCIVRVFKTLDEYRQYRSSTGEDDQSSCGLWDPSREELLVAAEDPKEALSTMRHESFHQYLHFATGRGDHALWFNEGHATLFENVKRNTAKNTLTPVDEGTRAGWVARNPEYYANRIKTVVAFSREQFMSGNVNDNYVTAWAVCYFLEKGAYTSEAFAPYRGICAKYLELMDAGASPAEATEGAWKLVYGRDVAADFLKFWKERRRAAVNLR